MAKIKATQLNNGFSAEYWRVNFIEVNKDSVNTEFFVAGYKDKAARLDGAKPITSKKFIVKTSEFDFTKDLFEQAYKLIETTKEFKDSFNPDATPFFADAVNDL